jgi:dynein heavy chain
MLVSVNDLLASGEVPELFAPEDRDEIVNAMRAETKAAGLLDTAENCWGTFIRKVGGARQSQEAHAAGVSGGLRNAFA